MSGEPEAAAPGRPAAATRTAGATPWLLVPLALAALAYWRVLDGQFQFDDVLTVEHNLAVKDLEAFLRRGLWDGYLHGGRPVTDLTFALNYAVGRLTPWNYHLTNLALHLAVVLLAWALARALLRLAGAGRADWVAVGVAGVFALHPLQSQAVAYVSQRAEVLASAAYLGALLLALAAERRPPRRALPLLAAALATFALGLGAKAIVVTMPAAWLLLGWLVPSRAARSRRWPAAVRALAAAPFLLVALLHGWATVASLGGQSNAGFSMPGLPPSTYFLTQWKVLLTYLRLVAWPAGQSVDWDFPPARDPWEPALLWSGAALLALLCGAAWLLRAGRARDGADGADGAAARVAGAGVLWFFLLLAPTSSVVPLADVLVEHRAYLAILGPLLAAGVGLERALARWPRRRAAVAGAALLALLWAAPAVALHRRNAVWESQRALWSDAVEKAPRKGRPRLWLALSVLKAGDLEGAVTLFADALRYADDEAQRVQALRNMGGGLLRLGRPREAEAALRQALPWGQFDADLLNNLGAALAEQGRLDEAEGFARRATEVQPWKSEGWATLGDLALRRGDAAGALRLFDRALALDPDEPGRHYVRAVALFRLGRLDEACRAFRAVSPGPDAQLGALLERYRRDPACAGR